MTKTSLLPQEAAEARPIHVPAYGNGVLRPFQPDRSGNPSGKGGQWQEAQSICRLVSPAAARKMVILMDSNDEGVALMAAERVLELAWGKPRQMSDTAMVDPAATERREAAGVEVIRMLQAMAKPEPLIESEADQGHRLPDARESRRAAMETERPAANEWPR
jgi:hypothetical protein